jgi:predicted naringenin-chalcone synthase
MQCYNNEAGELGVKASHRALAAAQITADQFTHIITVSCTGFYAPGFDIEIINRLGLPRTVQRTHVGFMGCHGAMNALRVAQAFADRQPSARILVCAVELCSLHFQYGWAPDKLVANSLFSDGAAALIMAGDESAVKTRCGLHKGSGSVIVEDTADAMRWYIGDNGFQMQLSSQVPNIVANTLANWLSSWLRQYDIAVGDITNWAVHPGGPRILDAVEQCLQLPESALLASRTVFEQCGNMSSPTVLFIIEELLRAKASGPCVVLGFGPGLTIEAALLLLD